MLIKTAAKQLTPVNMYTPSTLLQLHLIILTVISTPKTAPTGMMPIRTERAAKESIVTLYSATMV